MRQVYIFRGTFDPLHKNHEAIIRYCLSQANITARVVIHINNRPLGEESKKTPASWETRAEVIKRTVGNDVDIAPIGSFMDTLTWAKKNYGADVKIIEIVGSDVFDKLEASSQKYKDSIDSYLIAIRSRASIPKTLCEKPVIEIPPEIQQPNISSTAIRKLLLTRDKQEIEKYVSPNAAIYLLEAREYSPLPLSARDLMLQSQCILSLASLAEIEKKFGNEVHLTHSENQGLSGDYLLLIKEKDGTIQAMCKLFQNSKDAQLETNGYRLFQEHGLKIPMLYFCLENCVCIEYVHGHKPKTIEDFKQVGAAFRKLHESTKKGANQTEQSNEIKNVTRKIAELKFKNTRLEKNIQEIYAVLLSNYSAAERARCITHGDSQSGNILINEKNELVFIDLNKTDKSEDAFRDVYQMCSAIFWRAINGYDREIVSVSDVKLLNDKVYAFFEGYNHRSMTPEKLFWKFYWSMRMLSLIYKERINSVPEEIFDEIGKQIKLLACEIFSECLTSDVLSIPSLQPNAFWSYPIVLLLNQSLEMVKVTVPRAYMDVYTR